MNSLSEHVSHEYLKQQCWFAVNFGFADDLTIKCLNAAEIALQKLIN